MIDQPGVYELPMAEYLADPVIEPSLSSHIAHLLLTRSPRHARWAHPRLTLAPPAVPTEAQDLGTLAHQLILERRRASEIVTVAAKDWRSKAAQRERIAARTEGQIALLEADFAELERMLDAWREQFLRLDPLPFRGAAERTLVWREEDVWCRARPDAWDRPGQWIDDLKTTSTSAHPADWTRRRLWETGYDLQAAFHLRAATALTGTRPDFRFIVCETVAPYGVSAIALDPEALAVADQKRILSVEMWRNCRETGVWQGYSIRTAYAEVPPWERARWEAWPYYQEEAR